MRLHLDTPDGQRISAYGEGWVDVNGQRHEGPLMVGSDYCRSIGEVISAVSELGGQHSLAKEVIEQSPQVLIVGTGASFQMAPIGFVKACSAAGIGVESMDTPAACRTYNVIASESRHVIALLFH